MKTNTIYTALTAILAAVLTLSVTSESMAQSSSRRNNSGGNSTSTQRSSDSRQKAAPASQPSNRSTATPQNRNTSVSPHKATTATPDRQSVTPQNRNNGSSSNKNGNAGREATQSRGNSSGVNTGRNYNDHMGNVRTNPGIGNDKKNTDNKGNHGNVNNPPKDNKVNPPRDNKVTPPKDNKVNPPKENNKPNNNGPRPTYYAGRGGDAASKLPPAPKYDRSNPNRHLGYNPFRDGRLIHRPAPVVVHYDFGIRFNDRPRNYYRYRINGMSMYFWGGVWYWHAYGFYNVHRPPVGTRVPISSISAYLYPVDFEYYSEGFGRDYYVDSYANFYVQVNSYELKVVDAPDGAILYDMPSDYEEIVYNGRVYYVVGNSIFEYVYSNVNSWYFRAVGIYYR